MLYTIKFFFSFIFLCGIFSSSIASEHKGDSLYAWGNYFEASIEYDRSIFNAEKQANISTLRYKKALCFKKMLNFGRALEELQPLFFSNPEDSLYQQVCYEQSLCYYLNGESQKALWKIDEYYHRCTDTTTFSVFMPIKILSLNESQQWEEATECFMKFIQTQSFVAEKESEMQQMVINLYKKKKRPHFKSVNKAENWSRFIPGSGQIYSGKTREGLVNFLLNATILAFTAQQIYTGFYITGYLAGLGLFNKTYHGGIKRAGVIATQRNMEEFERFNRKVNETIRSNFELN
jgi:tetratricopeptide (TPR) repeat protein